MPSTPNNKGFSLVEMLVALVMLALIITPLLHSFVTATRTSEKARATGDATAAAQNIVESLESIPMNILTKNEGLTNANRFSA
ncbi:MAG: type II secretion system protein, partial [Evtepia sp.]